MQRKGIFPLTDFEWDIVLLIMIVCSGTIFFGLLGRFLTTDPFILYPAPVIAMCLITLKASEDVRKKIARGERVAATTWKPPEDPPVQPSEDHKDIQ